MLSELVARNDFRSESDAVRAAVETLLDSRFTPEEREQVLAKLRARSELDLNDFVADGEDAGRILENVIVRGLDDGKDD